MVDLKAMLQATERSIDTTPKTWQAQRLAAMFQGNWGHNPPLEVL
jgi:hypothetical protein